MGKKKKTSPKSMNRKRTPTISLCMIVKNEEQFLGQCLNSVKDYVNEMIVVDTGSTDKTIEIAKGFGAKVYHHPWENDFSKHKNQAIAHATGDWIFIMDADEELRQGSGPILKKAVANTQIDAVIVTLVSYFNNKASQSWESKIRLFKNHPSIRYEGIVHEQLVGYKSARMYPIYLQHYGYDLDPEQQQKKFERTSSLLKRQIKEDPENYWHHHNLAVCYSSNFMFSEAVEEGMCALALAEDQGLRGPTLLWTLHIVAASYLKLGNLSKAEDLALKALKQSKNHLDPHFILVLIYHQQKQWKSLERHAKAFFRVVELMKSSPESFAGSIINMAGEGWRVRLAMGDLHLERNELEKARAAFEIALTETPVPFECLKIIADCYKNHCLWKGAAHFYRQAINEKQDFLEAVFGLALSKNRLGQKNEAIRYYEKALELKPDSIEALVNLGDLHYEQGLEDLAQEFYERAMDVESNLINVSLRLANFSVKKGEIEKCVSYCENIFISLGLSCNRPLESVSDLANLFLIIGHELDKAGRDDLFREAMEIAIRIKPDLLQG